MPTKSSQPGVNGANRKSGLVPILVRPLADIRPSPENSRLYRPVKLEDPEVIALAESIRQHGLREPIVITLDNIILSGHRRYVASRLAGLKSVRCRVENIRSTDPDFLLLLREYNRQRVKSFDEVVREEIVSASPEEAHRVLVEHRTKRARVKAQTIAITGKTHRAKISAGKQPMLQAIVNVLNDLRAYWPLSDRRVHYALLNDAPLRHAKKPGSVYRNDQDSYKDTCDMLTRARIFGLIPWKAIDDPTRPMVTWAAHATVATFVRRELDGFLKGYYRDLLQSQPNHLEIVGEKNTIASTIRPVAMEYCIPFTLGRGYCSSDRRQQMAARYGRSGKEKLVILALSDFDPEGEDIAHSFARSMRDDFGIESIVPIKVALTADQVRDLNLPPKLKAKETSSRFGKFMEQHGDNVFELEALHPADLQRMLRSTIDSVIDVDAFNAEIDTEKRDAAKLQAVRARVKVMLSEMDFNDLD
jgi:hypothetical protein